MDIREILASIQKRYHLKLPKRVVAVDFGEKGDLYVRFKHVENPQGEPASDGRVIFFFENRSRKNPVAVEILDMEGFTK